MLLTLYICKAGVVRWFGEGSETRQKHVQFDLAKSLVLIDMETHLAVPFVSRVRTDTMPPPP